MRDISMPSDQNIKETELNDLDNQNEEIELIMQEEGLDSCDAASRYAEEYEETNWEDNVEDED